MRYISVILKKSKTLCKSFGNNDWYTVIFSLKSIVCIILGSRCKEKEKHKFLTNVVTIFITFCTSEVCLITKKDFCYANAPHLLMKIVQSGNANAKSKI